MRGSSNRVGDPRTRQFERQGDLPSVSPNAASKRFQPEACSASNPLVQSTAMRFIKAMCPRYQAAVEVLGKRWTGLILNVLLEGPQRFCELASRLEPVSERMLSERLKELESHGILRRRVLPDAPVRVQYELSDKGRALNGVINAIADWAEVWVEPMQSVPEAPGVTAEHSKA